jgi:hypothetical protein
VRLDKTTRGKWRIPDGKVESGLFSYSELLRCLNVEVLYHHVHMRFMVNFNYDYLVVKNDDTKNG